MSHQPKNTYSKPFHTEEGWNIIQVLDQKNVDITHDAEVSEAKNILTHRRFEEIVPIWIRQLKNDAYVKILL